MKNSNITKRDFFAAAALQGMIASETQGNGILPQFFVPNTSWYRAIADKAFSIADAMVKFSTMKGKRNE